MTDAETKIYFWLRTHPDMIYITPDGSKLYMLVITEMAYLTGANFREMDNDQISQFISNTLQAHMKGVRP